MLKPPYLGAAEAPEGGVGRHVGLTYMPDGAHGAQAVGVVGVQ